jgi:hypothetical protein
VALALFCEGAVAALCARARGELASKLSANADKARQYAARVMCRNKVAIDSLVKSRLGPERRVGADRGQNVAAQLKRIGFKTSPSGPSLAASI